MSVKDTPEKTDYPQKNGKLIPNTSVANLTEKNVVFHPEFKPMQIFYHPRIYIKDFKQIINEIVSAIIVAFAQVPESIAFALLANVEPILGLQSAWMIGLIVHSTGGRPGMISGATGGIGAILTPFMQPDTLGVNYLPYILLFAGIFVMISALFNVHKLARLIPETVMIGFVNGLAIIIGWSQLHTFDKAHGDIKTLGWMTGLAIITFCTIEFLPKLTTKLCKKCIIPSSLIGILLCTAVEYLIIRLACNMETPLIKDLGNISGTLPGFVFTSDNWDVPPLNKDTFNKIITPAILILLVSITEDVMTIDVVADLTETPQNSYTKQQLFSMGFANIIGALFGTMGGHATIGLSMINCHVGSNGYYRISGVLASIFVLCILLFAAPALQAIPAAALIGVMSVVVYHTFEWNSLLIVIVTFMPLKIRTYLHNKLESLKSHSKINRTDAFVIILVTGMTILTNLAYAVISGIIFSALAYSWQSGFEFNVTREVLIMSRKSMANIYNKHTYTNSNTSNHDDHANKGENIEMNIVNGPESIKNDDNNTDIDDDNPAKAMSSKLETKLVIYHFEGPLFFGNCRSLHTYFKPNSDPDQIEIHLRDASIFDYSAINSLNGVALKYKDLGKKVHLRHINIKSHKIIKKARHLSKHFTYENVIEHEVKDDGEIKIKEPTKLNVTKHKDVLV